MRIDRGGRIAELAGRTITDFDEYEAVLFGCNDIELTETTVEVGFHDAQPTATQECLRLFLPAFA